MRYKQIKVIVEPMKRIKGGILYLNTKASILSFKCPILGDIVDIKVDTTPTTNRNHYYLDTRTLTLFPSVKRSGKHYSIVKGNSIVHNL